MSNNILVTMLNWIKRKKPITQEILIPKRRIVDNEAIRGRIQAQGWRLLEIPIKKNTPNKDERVVARWKIVASRGEKSIEVGGATIEEALANIGKTLGVITREK